MTGKGEGNFGTESNTFLKITLALGSRHLSSKFALVAMPSRLTISTFGFKLLLNLELKNLLWTFLKITVQSLTFHVFFCLVLQAHFNLFLSHLVLSIRH
uniref:Uncharacterized protein n=1 Tax=Arundo donax TaxID=35708 RepID=A0A0A9GJI1_ARUDO